MNTNRITLRLVGRLLSYQAIAAIIVFGSWLVEKWLLADVAAERHVLQAQETNRLGLLCNASIYWSLFLQEKQRPNRDPKVVAYAAKNTVAYSWIAVESDRVLSPEGQHTERPVNPIAIVEHLIAETLDMDKTQLPPAEGTNARGMPVVKVTPLQFEKAMKVREGPELEKVIAFVQDHMTLLEQEGGRWESTLVQRLHALTDRERLLNRVFIVLYVIGALVGGGGYLFRRFRDTRSVTPSPSHAKVH
ncbi:MAG: hypothetical protein WC869_08060 [Phycisphaerae bacterium]|jgi:hypothetical protein